MVTFSEDKKSATVLLNASLTTGQKYKVAVLDNNKTPKLSNVLFESGLTEIVKGVDVPEVSVADKQNEFTLKFAKKMNAASETTTNYTVYDSSNTAISAAVSTAAFVSGSGDKEVKLTIAADKLKAGQTYSVIVNNTNVKADDNTELTTAQSKFTIKTPSVTEAKPKVVSTQVTAGNEVVVTFDKDLKTNAAVDPDLLSVKKADGTPIALTSAAISGKTLTITTTGAADLEAGKAYKVDVAANVAINDVYRNAASDSISTTAVAAANKAATGMTAKLVRDADDKEKYDVILSFDQPVNGFTASAGDITVNALGETYGILASTIVDEYTKDSTGKSLIIKDAAAAFTGLSVQSGTTYQVVANTGVIETTTPATTPETNKKDLKASFTGIDVEAPKVDTVTLASADKITVKFDEAINAANLSAGDIKVKGFVKGLDGGSTQTTLTGANQLKFSVSGDTLTITPAKDSVKFVTGNLAGAAVTDLVTIAKEAIKDTNGIENAAAYQVDSDDAEVTDAAAPIIISASTVDANELDVTYSEDVTFKSTSSNKEAAQFAVSGVKANQLASTAAVQLTGNVIKLTFTGSFEAGKDYSAAKLTYTKNVNYFVKDADDNQAPNGSTTGLKSGF